MTKTLLLVIIHNIINNNVTHWPDLLVNDIHINLKRMNMRRAKRETRRVCMGNPGQNTTLLPIIINHINDNNVAHWPRPL